MLCAPLASQMSRNIVENMTFLLPLIIWYQFTWSSGNELRIYWREMKQFSCNSVSNFRFACYARICSTAGQCSAAANSCRSSNVTHALHAINGSWNIPIQYVSKLLDNTSSMCCGDGWSSSDPDQGQLSWDHQDPSDKNLDCNEWKHWNGSQWCGRRGHVMLEWLAQLRMVRENQSIPRPLWPQPWLVPGRP